MYVATRESVDDPWSAPVNLGTAVNTAAGESRPSLSWDARTLYFGRAPGPEGQSDIYVTTRDKVRLSAARAPAAAEAAAGHARPLTAAGRPQPGP